jgi:hypothetical protein
VPEGFSEELCPDLSRDRSGLALRIVVPDDYVRGEKGGPGCYFQADLDRDLSVSMGSTGTLLRLKEKEIDPNAGYEGDDGVGDIEYVDDVPVLGRHRGELLTWGSNNDGLPLDNRLVQAAGVRLAWHTPQGKSARYADDLEVVTDSIAVVRTRRATYVTDSATVSYVVPRQTAEIDDGTDYCYLYLRPRSSLLRYAEIDPDPRFSVDQLVRRLPGRKDVVSVRLERGAATLLEEPADRLTWVIVRPHRTWDGPKGTWRIVMVARDDLQVTWGASPAQWRQEQADVDAFVRSVRVSPARPSRS